MSSRFGLFRVGSWALSLLIAADAVAGQLTLSPSLVDFGSVAVSGPAAQQIVQVVNYGAPTTITGFTPTNGCNEFSATAAGLPVTLADRETLLVQVAYNPANRGPDLCGFTVQDNNGRADVIGVTGIGLAPGLRVLEPSLSFTTQPWPGGVPETLYVSIENQGNESITAPHLSTQMVTGAHFSLLPIALPILPNGASDLPVVFHPSSAGPKSDQIQISLDNGLSGDSNMLVSVEGTWVDATGVGQGPLADSPLRIEPSPTLGTARIACSVPRAGRLRIEVRDLAGRIVARLESVSASAGLQSVTLRRGHDWSPAPGVYLVRAALDGEIVGRGRVVVLK